MKQELHSVTCDPACGFMVRSHDSSELIRVTRQHGKSVHNMDMADDDIKKIIKAA